MKKNRTKKIGIITQYNNSLNYGGNLQAYALCKVLEKIGYCSEQIRYPANYGEGNKQDFYHHTLINRILKKTVINLNKLKGSIYCTKTEEYKKKLDEKKKNFINFNKFLIPNSKKEYDDNNINECLKDYDIFITGSDQVWNMTEEQFQEGYFLNFVPKSKIKASYAASISMNRINAKQLDYLICSIKDYDYISVREKETKELLEEHNIKSVKLVLDPTLLLTSKEWGLLCTRKRNKKYVFCYFLGKNSKSRKIAIEYSLKHNIDLVVVRNIENTAFCNDNNTIEFLDSASPEEFITLIKNADTVFTDSFHAVVFSYIFKKQFYIFKREKNDSMTSRITSLLEIINLESRFCNTEERETLTYIESLPKIKEWEKKKFNKLKGDSINYLKKICE